MNFYPLLSNLKINLIYCVIMLKCDKKGEKKMIISDKLRKKLFLTIYTVITAVLIINTIKSEQLVDIVYTFIFVCIYLRYIYISLS